MFNIARAIKPWRETAELNDHISLYGFWNETVFVTKAGDVGMVLKVEGVDYESLDQSEQDSFSKTSTRGVSRQVW